MAEKKPKADTSWITDDLLDALAWAESTWDPTAESKSGAMGLYQFMPQFYKKGEPLGYKVPTGPFDATDPVVARNMAKAYLEGMQKYYPTWDPTEVLMAYNWGPGMVNKYKSGDLDLEEYANESDWKRQKLSEAMNYAPKVLKALNEQPWTELVKQGKIKHIQDLLYRGEPEQIQDLLDRGEPSTYMLLDEDPFASTI